MVVVWSKAVECGVWEIFEDEMDAPGDAPGIKVYVAHLVLNLADNDSHRVRLKGQRQSLDAAKKRVSAWNRRHKSLWGLDLRADFLAV